MNSKTNTLLSNISFIIFIDELWVYLLFLNNVRELLFLINYLEKECGLYINN